MGNNLFKDLKVVELAGVLAGPAAGMFFAEMGARVIKVENARTGGDITRSWKNENENPESQTSAYYHSVNYNKEVIFLDLQTETGRNNLQELLNDADILITNFRDKDAIKFELKAEDLRVKYPDLIIAQIRGYEDNDRPAYDLVLQAETGWMSMNGTAVSGPVKIPVAIIDLFAASQLKEGILCALVRKMKTGTGCIVDVSLYRSGLAALANQASNWLNSNFLPGLSGSLHPNIAPYGEIFKCSDDRKFVIAIGSDQQFERFCTGLGETGIYQNPDFSTNGMRIRNRSKLFEVLQGIIKTKSSLEMERIINDADIPGGFIKNMEEVFRNPFSEPMILSSSEPDGTISKRVRSVAFKIIQ